MEATLVDPVLDGNAWMGWAVAEEAAKVGPLHVRIPSDALLERQTGTAPRFRPIPVDRKRPIGRAAM